MNTPTTNTTPELIRVHEVSPRSLSSFTTCRFHPHTSRAYTSLVNTESLDRLVCFTPTSFRHAHDDTMPMYT